MIRDFEAYHGSALRDIIICSSPDVIAIQAFDDVGRLNTYRINGHVGLHIKHSSARLSPWGFAITGTTGDELSRLRDRVTDFWLALACGEDGVVFLRSGDVSKIVDLNSTITQNIRVERKKRQMYRVSGTLGSLERAIRRGAADFVSQISSLGTAS